MTVNWGDYAPLPDELLVKTTDAVERKEAWRLHRERLRHFEIRQESFSLLCRRSGIDLGPRGHRDCAAVEELVRNEVLHQGSLELNPDRRVPSFVHDAAMMFGDELIARYPTLSWELKRNSPNDLHYQCTVIMGFTRAKNNQYSTELPFGFARELLNDLQGATPREFFKMKLSLAEQYA